MMRTVVVGLGNVLMGDDGLGPHVLRALGAAYEVDDGVSLLDLGTPGLDLVPHLMDADAVVVVDTVKSGGPPGELRLYRRDELLRRGLAPRVTPHAPGLQETLLTLDLLGRGPEQVLLVGVIPGPVDLGLGLSIAVEAAVPDAVHAVIDELERLGHEVTPREVAVEPRAWWAAAGEHFTIPSTRG
jgi:hydrogenase maturation protease